MCGRKGGVNSLRTRGRGGVARLEERRGAAQGGTERHSLGRGWRGGEARGAGGRRARWEEVSAGRGADWDGRLHAFEAWSGKIAMRILGIVGL